MTSFSTRSCAADRVSVLSAAAALAAGALLAGQGRAAPATTTSAVDWDARVDTALAVSGNVDAVAAGLSAEPSTASEVLHAKARVAVEQGDLAAALRVLQTQAQTRPGDPAVRRRLAYVQELVGATAAAEQTLRDAADAESDPAAVAAVLLRLAAIALDDGRVADATTLLGRAGASGPQAAGRAGVVAYFYGQYATAVECLHRAATSADGATRLLEGNAALKAGRTDAAAAAFALAAEQARTPADRSYAQDRQVAAARQAGALPALVDRWLADPHLPADRLLPMATVLRELGRDAQLLTWWRAAGADPARQAGVFGDRLVREVLAAARTAGRAGEAASICDELLARTPDDPARLDAAVQAHLAAGQADRADTLLRSRLTCAQGVPGDLERLGRLAQASGRDAVAVEAAGALARCGEGYAITGALMAAAVYRRAGDTGRAGDALARAGVVALEHPAGLGRVVSALERAGLNQKAVALLQEGVRRDPSEDNLGLLASLLNKQGRPAEAAAVLERLAATATTVAARAQAGNRLLDACEATQTVPALVERLRANLAGGRGGEETLTLLVDAYMRTGQFDAAADALRTSPLLDEPTRLGRLAVLQLRHRRLDDARQTLTRLVDADPGSAVETLERIAAVDVARNRPEDAAATTRRIARRLGDGPASAETMAAVLDRLGRPDEAAAEYRRALAARPDKSENWLLWATAMDKARHGAAARRRLQVLCGEAASDDLFATAVDGLLNLKASGAALRVARRDAVLRVAERPRATMLYHVIADLSDEMRDPAAAVRATEAGVAVSDEERPQRLRELMETASGQGDLATATDCGRSLLALGDEFPPQLFLRLAEQLLVAGRPAEAARAIAGATDAADADSLADRVADLYEQYAYPAAALDTLRPLADRRRGDAAFLRTLGRLSGIVGDADASFESFFAATRVAVRDVAVDRSPPAKLSPAVQNFGPLISGLLGAARTTGQQGRVLDLLRASADAVLADPDAGDRPTAGAVALATATRRAAMAFARPDAADAVDAAVIRRWPGDAFGRDAVDARVKEGLIVWAARFADAHGLTPPTRARPLVSTRPAENDLSSAAVVLPGLIARGDLDRAKSLLKSVPVSVPGGQPPAAYGRVPEAQTMVMAASALGEPEAARQWAVAWLDAGLAKPGGSASVVVNGTWLLLDAAGRLAVADRLARGTDPQNAADALQAAAALGRELPETQRLITAAMAVRSNDPAATLSRLLAAVPIAYRPAALRDALARVPADLRLGLLTAVVGQAAGPLDDGMLAVLREAVGRLPAGQVPRWGEWFCNGVQAPALSLLAEATLRTAVPDGGPLTPASYAAAAAAYRVAGDGAKADETGRRAIAALRIPSSARPTWQQPMPDRTGLLRLAVAALSADARRSALAEVEAQAKAAFVSQADAVWQRTLRGLILDASGDRAGALAAWRDAHAINPADVGIVRLLFARLQDDGRHSEQAELFAGRTAGSDLDAVQAKSIVSQSLCELYRWREARAAVADEIYNPPPNDLATRVASDDAGGLAVSLRTQIASTLGGKFQRFPTVPRAAGLIDPWPATPFAVRLDPPAAYGRAAESPGAWRDLLQAVRVPAESAGGSLDPGRWVVGVLAGAASDPAAFDRVVEALRPAVDAHTLTRRQRQLAMALLRVPGRSLPPAWIEELLTAALAEPRGEELRDLARGLAVTDAPFAPSVTRWVDAINKAKLPLSLGETNRTLPAPLEPVDDAAAAALAAVCDDNPAAAEAQLAVLRDTGRVPARATAVGLLWARCAAERGDIDALRDRLRRTLRDWAWQRVAPPAFYSTNPPAAVDLAAVLPVRGAAAGRRAVAAAVADEVVALARDWPSNTDLVRQLAALGDRVARSGDREAAEMVLHRVRAFVDRRAVGEPQLWVADLATRLGQEDVAIGLQKEMLAARCLPAPRINSLLRKLAARGDVDAARSLAADAATYCPNVRPPAAENDGPR